MADPWAETVAILTSIKYSLWIIQFGVCIIVGMLAGRFWDPR
jgi:hypothetical protein